MAKKSTVPTAQLGELNAQLKKLQTELLLVTKASAIDKYLGVRRTKNESRFERIKKKDQPDGAIGHYVLILDITAKKETVFIPLSIASGKKQTGFIYHIEGTGDSSIISANVKCSGDGVTKVTLGTIVYAKIPPLKIGTFSVQIEIRGKIGKSYKFLIHRINYKLAVTEARYSQYTSEIMSDTLKFS